LEEEKRISDHGDEDRVTQGHELKEGDYPSGRREEGNDKKFRAQGGKEKKNSSGWRNKL